MTLAAVPIAAVVVAALACVVPAGRGAHRSAYGTSNEIAIG
jgi:hypothetical protein